MTLQRGDPPARQPKLQKKTVGTTTYRLTKAGDETYFGNVDDVEYRDALKLFRDHVKALNERVPGAARG